MNTRDEKRQYRTKKIMEDAGITEKASCKMCGSELHFNYNVGNRFAYSMACPKCKYRTKHYKTAIEAYNEAHV